MGFTYNHSSRISDLKSSFFTRSRRLYCRNLKGVLDGNKKIIISSFKLLKYIFVSAVLRVKAKVKKKAHSSNASCSLFSYHGKRSHLHQKLACFANIFILGTFLARHRCHRPRMTLPACLEKRRSSLKSLKDPQHSSTALYTSLKVC